ncbi:hypothetical protein VNI00_016325 [Paramarasmius palmivorus]|uniref:NodB homology domain-containing protein n=1 Tax=Paramarasmius palmivorus TaxID=297713 RepID=A0AAW0BEW1_9AGAR
MKLSNALGVVFLWIVSSFALPLEEKRQNLATVYYSCTQPNTVAFTFDDGPWIYSDQIVSFLRDQGVKATFFFNGNNYDCIYNTDAMNRVKNVYNNGHMVASHTWRHAHLTTLDWDHIHDEMWRVEQALWRIVGAYPAFVRAPYGEFNDLVRQVAAARGQNLVQWDYEYALHHPAFFEAWNLKTLPSSGDSFGKSADDVKNGYADLIRQHPNTILTLNHETLQVTATDAMYTVIPALKNAGYNLVTVAECLGMQPYQRVGSPQTPDSSWTC